MTKVYLGVDPFGLEGESVVWAIMAAGFGVLYKEGKDLAKRMDGFIERIAKLEVKVEKLEQPPSGLPFGAKHPE